MTGESSEVADICAPRGMAAAQDSVTTHTHTWIKERRDGNILCKEENLRFADYFQAIVPGESVSQSAVAKELAPEISVHSDHAEDALATVNSTRNVTKALVIDFTNRSTRPSIFRRKHL